jgi:hypothetical protein
VAIGMHLEVAAVRAELVRALQPVTAPASAAALRRLQRYGRLSC